MVQIDDQHQIIRVVSEEKRNAGLKKAADVILSGGLVAYPTESFYGLAVNAMDVKAIERLFELKKRGRDQPVLILIPSKDVLCQYVTSIPRIAHQLIGRFWPGGLTLVFNAAPAIPSSLTGGTGKIGIRHSNHDIATRLTRISGVPITGTSANISGQPPSVNAREVFQSIGKDVDIILDGGETKGAPGSTLLDITTTPPTIIREGMIDREKLKEFIPT